MGCKLFSNFFQFFCRGDFFEIFLANGLGLRTFRLDAEFAEFCCLAAVRGRGREKFRRVFLPTEKASRQQPLEFVLWCLARAR